MITSLQAQPGHFLPPCLLQAIYVKAQRHVENVAIVWLDICCIQALCIFKLNPVAN